MKTASCAKHTVDVLCFLLEKKQEDACKVKKQVVLHFTWFNCEIIPCHENRFEEAYYLGPQ